MNDKGTLRRRLARDELTRGHPRLAAAGQDRRPGEDRLARHRPRRTGQPPVRDLRYARQDLYVDPAKASAAKETTLALEPARIIEGRVLAADTGQPIPNAVVSATARVMNEHANGFFTAKFRADAEGRFIMNPIAGESYTLGAFPTGGEPYLIQQDEFKWTKGAVKATHDIKVRRGVLIRGKVTEAGTGRPLPASSIQFIPVRGGDDVLSGWQAIVASQDDGSFQIAVPPARGTCSSSARPATTSSARSAPTGSTTISPAGCATTPTPSSPTRSRPATRRTKSPRRCGRA